MKSTFRMKTLVISIGLLSTLLLCGPLSTVKPRKLKLLKALPIESDRPQEPSGIVKRGQEFFVISDNDDSTIFRLAIEQNRARLEPAVRFVATPPDGEAGKLDFEGISTDSEGNFYLVSEACFRILRVGSSGAAAWIGPDLAEAGKEVGLFQVGNGGLEGIAVTGLDRFVLCAERQARGILELQLGAGGPSISAWNCDQSRISAGTGQRLPDFSDVFWEKGKLFAMVRGAEVVVQLERKGEDFEEKSIWSVKDTLTSDAYAYEDQTFGMAEGLCLDARRVYIVVDNNGDSRASEPTDTRPLLFIFERP